MTRISRISLVYCSLETPARSAAPYAHQWHTNPNIFGLNSRPALIGFSLVYWVFDNKQFHTLFVGFPALIILSAKPSRPRQGVFGKPGKLFERERVLAGLSKNALAWP
jgi:hypothetical protein